QWGRIQPLPGNQGTGATTETSQWRATRRIRSATKTPKAGCRRLGNTVLRVRTRISAPPPQARVQGHVPLDDARPAPVADHGLPCAGPQPSPGVAVAGQPRERVHEVVARLGGNEDPGDV